MRRCLRAITLWPAHGAVREHEEPDVLRWTRRGPQREKEQELRQLQLAAIESNKQIETQKLQDAIAHLQREEEQRQADLKARVARETALAKYEQALPEIREYLVPFIKDGATQPGKRYTQYESAAEIGPVSFSAIQRFGALEETPKGLFVLHALGAQTSNDRP